MENRFKNKKVLILGLGLNQGGVGSAKFFARQGAKVRVTDLKNAETLKLSLDQLKEFSNIEYTLGSHSYLDIDWADIVIRNPALRPNNEYRIYAEKQSKATTDLGVFLEYVNPDQVVGITGTKGKSTTSSLIYQALKNGGKKTVYAGNIGRSVLDTLETVESDTTVVLELSSFQLEAFGLKKVSPKWAVITNIMRDHLNYYSSMQDYINAKKIIAKYQRNDDFLFLRENDPVTTTSDFLAGLQSQIQYFSSSELPREFSPHLLGEHNLENIAAAYFVARGFNIDEQNILNSLASFKGVEFRMQLIKEWHGIKIYNDTAATTPDAAMSALNSFKNPTLIAGGMDKNLDFEKFAKTIDEKAKNVYFLVGDATDKIISLMKNKTLIKGTFDNIDTLLTEISKNLENDDVILFSPGATSFNLFQNEFDRGRKFNSAVDKVFTNK